MEKRKDTRDEKDMIIQRYDRRSLETKIVVIPKTQEMQQIDEDALYDFRADYRQPFISQFSHDMKRDI